MLDFLTFALCAPYSETTDGTYFDVMLEMVAGQGRFIFKLFQVNIYLKAYIYTEMMAIHLGLIV